MDTAVYTKLTAAAKYRGFKNSVEGFGIVDILFGILCIVAGIVYALVLSPVNIILVLIGMLLIGIGIWAVQKQSLNSLLFSDISLLVLGSWNLVVCFLNTKDIVIRTFTPPHNDIVSSWFIATTIYAFV